MLSEQLAPLVVDQLKAAALFGGRVEFAASLAAILANRDAVDLTLRAHVIPALLIGRTADAMVGTFVQAIERGITVLITMPSFAVKAEADGNRIEDLVIATIAAIAGWGPENTPGVFRLAQGQLLSMTKGVTLYQIDFVISDQLRKQT